MTRVVLLRFAGVSFWPKIKIQKRLIKGSILGTYKIVFLFRPQTNFGKLKAEAGIGPKPILVIQYSIYSFLLTGPCERAQSTAGVA
jgi:hypothetical protein